MATKAELDKVRVAQAECERVMAALEREMARLNETAALVRGARACRHRRLRRY